MANVSAIKEVRTRINALYKILTPNRYYVTISERRLLTKELTSILDRLHDIIKRLESERNDDEE